MSSRPTILVVRSQKLQATAAGGQLRGQALERGFESAGDVVVAYAVPSADEDVDAACVRAALWGRWAGGAPRLEGRDDVQALVSSSDVVFLQDFAAFWWSGIADPRKTIIDIDNVRSQFWHQRVHEGSLLKQAVKQARYRWSRYSERALLDRFRAALVCSDEDAAYLRHPAVTVVPNSYHPTPLMDQEPDPAPRYDMLFVGTLFYPPNLEGLRWFVDEVLPLIRQRQPDATLTVVGRAPNPIPPEWRWLQSPGVQLLGTVPDVGVYVRSAKLEVCPLHLGGGTRIKLIESSAFGTPAVATSIGAYGLKMSEGEGLYRRDSAEAFANTCVELLLDRSARERTRASARRFVHHHYSPDVVQQRVRELVSAIVDGPR